MKTIYAVEWHHYDDNEVGPFFETEEEAKSALNYLTKQIDLKNEKAAENWNKARRRKEDRVDGSSYLNVYRKYGSVERIDVYESFDEWQRDEGL